MVTSPPFDIQPTLQGQTVLLRPLTSDVFEPLFAVASDPEIWAMHPYRNRYEPDVFRAFFDEAIKSGGAFAVVELASGRIIGSTRFSNYDPITGEIEIGWTFFARDHWRNGTNREVKALMLRHIFPHVDTVIFQIGARNLRSRVAVERIGAVLINEHVREHDGEAHDYVTYQLTAVGAAQGALALATEGA